jgi:hypothetical protein
MAFKQGKKFMHVVEEGTVGFWCRMSPLISIWETLMIYNMPNTHKVFINVMEPEACLRRYHHWSY